MNPTTDDLRQQLAEQLALSGHLTSDAVALAFTSVPRHPFAPAVYHVDGNGQIGEILHSDRPDERDAYLDAVYSDNAIVTQVAADGRPTSSSTQPAVMAVMLEALDPKPGMRVLEIGTGTGYNAALLSELVGDQDVTTIDIDPDLVARAATALAEAGYHPTAIPADGLSGHARRAPYDRIIATCSVRRVPSAWLHQTRSGGIVLANMSYGVIPLRVDADGCARGRFLPQVASFIEARPADGPPGPTIDQIIETCMGGNGDRTDATEHDLALFIDERCEFFWRLVEPSVYQCGLEPPGEDIHCLVDAGSGSWARIHHREGELAVVQGGRRRVWDSVATACRRWEAAGRPSHDLLGLTVTPTGEHTVWIETPTNAMRWPLAV